MTILAYPAEETKIYARMVFYKYERPSPRSDTKITSIGSIRLPMPSSLPDSYSVKLNTPEFDIAGAIAGGSLADVYSAGGDIRDGAIGKGRLSKLGSSIAALAALAPGISDTTAGRIAQQNTGMVRNPHVTTIFEGVNLRSHTFTFKMSPKSKAEADTLKNIMQYIKVNMHPETYLGGLALLYPSLVTIEFVGTTNTTPVYYSFISRFQPIYSASGLVAFYSDGSPIDIEMTIELQELDILTRETIEGRSADMSNVNTASRELTQATDQARRDAFGITENSGI
jgi:hypothetical protein